MPDPCHAHRESDKHREALYGRIKGLELGTTWYTHEGSSAYDWAAFAGKGIQAGPETQLWIGVDMKKLIVLVVVAGAALVFWDLTREKVIEEGHTGDGVRPRIRLNLDAVGQPHIVLGPDRYSAGTGFLLEHNGHDYIATAFHVYLKRNEFLIRKRARVAEIERVELVRPPATSIAIADRALEMPRLGLADESDASGDVVLFEVSAGSKRIAGLRLASTAPLKGAPVWVVGVSGAAAARVALSSNKRLIVEYERSSPGGMLSGAPVVNARGEVVGSCALGNRRGCIAVPLQSLLDAVDS